MDNPWTVGTLGAHYTGRRQTKHKNTIQQRYLKQKMSCRDPEHLISHFEAMH